MTDAMPPIRVWRIEAIVGAPGNRDATIADPNQTSLHSAHFNGPGLTGATVRERAIRDLMSMGARWVVINKCVREHEIEVESEILLGEMILAMRSG